ncbi:MAG: hypothetical protein ACLRWP_17075 [Bilophila wadsworthia]
MTTETTPRSAFQKAASSLFWALFLTLIKLEPGSLPACYSFRGPAQQP